MADEYAEFRDAEAPTEDDLGQVEALVRAMLASEEAVEGLQEQLREATERLQKIREHEIPDLMRRFNLQQVKTRSGILLEVKRKIRAAPPADRRDEAYDWLEAAGEAALIKRNVIVPFGKEREGEAAEFLEATRAQFPDAAIARKVEPSTMSAWVRKRLEGGGDVPVDLFGVFQQEVAALRLPKAKDLPR